MSLLTTLSTPQEVTHAASIARSIGRLRGHRLGRCQARCLLTSRWRRHTGVQASRTPTRSPRGAGHIPSKRGSWDPPSRCASNAPKALSSMPSGHTSCLGLFPVNPVPVAKDRAACTPSHAKDDPTDAELRRERLLTHPDTLQPLHPPERRDAGARHLVAHRRRVVGDTVRLTTASPVRCRTTGPHAPPWCRRKDPTLLL